MRFKEIHWPEERPGTVNREIVHNCQCSQQAAAWCAWFSSVRTVFMLSHALPFYGIHICTLVANCHPFTRSLCPMCDVDSKRKKPTTQVHWGLHFMRLWELTLFIWYLSIYLTMVPVVRGDSQGAAWVEDWLSWLFYEHSPITSKND